MLPVIKYAFIVLLALRLVPAMAQPAGDTLRVYFFLAESCPICKSITQEIRFLEMRYAGEAVRFEGIFPNPPWSTPESRRAFAKKYKLNMPLYADSGQAMARRYDVKITPEVLVLNHQNQMVYRGLIDNSFASVGKRRAVVTEHYLRDAIDAWISQKTIPLDQTQPVGCLIQFTYE